MLAHSVSFDQDLPAHSSQSLIFIGISTEFLSFSLIMFSFVKRSFEY